MNLEDLEIGQEDWVDSSYLSTIHYCSERKTKKQFVLKRSRNPLPAERIELMKKVFQFSHPKLLFPVWWGAKDGFVEELYERVELPLLNKFLYKLKEDKRVKIADSLKIMLQLTDILSMFHREGIVHHDVRDRNIFVDSNSLEIRVFDYNSITKPYFLEEGIDSWNPVPPEYRKGDCLIDFQFDVYQSGYIFKNATHSFDFQLEKMVPMFDMPEKAMAIMKRALSEDRKERYKDCSEMHSELKSLI